MRLLAFAILFATFVGVWVFRYEPMYNGFMHRNRLTGAICHVAAECWFSNP